MTILYKLRFLYTHSYSIHNYLIYDYALCNSSRLHWRDRIPNQGGYIKSYYVVFENTIDCTFVHICCSINTVP